MHSRVFSFFTQEKEGSAAARSAHFLYSWSDFVHHFTVVTGLANTEAAKPNPLDALIMLWLFWFVIELKEEEWVWRIYRDIRAAPRGGEASWWRRWWSFRGGGPPDLRSRADRPGGSCGFYSRPDWTRTTDQTTVCSGFPMCVCARELWRAHANGEILRLPKVST